MSMKPVAYLAFVLNTVLFGTYYAVAKNALGHIDPVLFSFFEMITLAPAGLCILLCCWRRMTRAIVRRGMILGSSLCLALFTISIALKYTSATNTAFFPSLNGFLAALIAWLVLRQPVTKATWIAGILSVVGTTMLMLNSSMYGLRGVLIAFLGGIFFTIYVFLSDSTHEQGDERGEELAPLPLFGVELLTMAVWANLIVLLFGDWHAVHLVLPQDAWTVLYVAVACTFLPTLLAAFMQKHVSPVTISFIYILEPVFGAIIAYLYLHEMLPLYGYIGGALVIIGAIVHTWGTAKTREKHVEFTRETTQYANVWMKETARATGQNVNTRATTRVRPYYTRSRVGPHPILLVGILLYPLLLVGAGLVLFTLLNGLPPMAWRVLYSTVGQSNVQDYYGLWPLTQERGILLAQALCWLVAWSAFVVAVCIALKFACGMVVDMFTYRSVRAVQETRNQRHHYAEHVTDELVEEIDTLPMPTSYKTREQWQSTGRNESIVRQRVGA